MKDLPLWWKIAKLRGFVPEAGSVMPSAKRKGRAPSRQVTVSVGSSGQVPEPVKLENAEWGHFLVLMAAGVRSGSRWERGTQRFKEMHLSKYNRHIEKCTYYKCTIQYIFTNWTILCKQQNISKPHAHLPSLPPQRVHSVLTSHTQATFACFWILQMESWHVCSFMAGFFCTPLCLWDSSILLPRDAIFSVLILVQTDHDFI